MSNLQGIYNTSAFDGTIISDFLELGRITEGLKEQYIDYSVADFSEYKEALENYLKAVYPDDFNNFIESDLGIMIVDLFAYFASVMSLKADSIANEMFLPTVKSKGNLRKLLQLIGVSMRGPVSAKSSAVLTLGEDFILDDASHTVTIDFSDRVHSVANSRDSGALYYTLYAVNKVTGEVDTTSPNISQTSALSVNADSRNFDNLVLVEGHLKKQSSTFSTNNTIQTIDISEPSVAEGSIIVSSQEGIFTEIENMFLADNATSKVFQKVYNEDDSCTLIFGDNARGLSPLAGTPYSAYYRIGGGDRGNIPRNSLDITIPITHSTKGTGIATLRNTTYATGGRNAESVEHAKKWAPYTFKTQHRAVTGSDYTTFANQFVSTAGVAGKALAVLRKSGAAANMIDIFVVGKATDSQVERVNITYKQELLDYINKYKMITDHVTIADALVRTIDLSILIHLDREVDIFEEEIKRQVSKIVLDYFNVDNRQFGELFTLADLRREVHKVKDVRFSEVSNLDKDIRLNFNEIVQLNNLEINVEFV